MNQITTEEFRKLILQNKSLIFGTKFRTGQTVWKFAGAGEENLLFRSKKSGLDVTQASEGKFWVKYKNINPVIKGSLISETVKAKSFNERVKNELNGMDEVPEDVSLKQTYEQLREEIGAKKAVPKTAKQLGFIPGNEIELY